MSATLSPLAIEQHTPIPKRLSVPNRRLSSFDASSLSGRSRHGSIITSNAVSPVSHRGSPNNDHPEFIRPPLVQRHTSLTFADSISHRGSYDSPTFPQEGFPTEDGRAKGLNLDDQNCGTGEDLPLASHAGMKRRASSPQRALVREQRSSIGSVASAADIYHRRSLQHFPNMSGTNSRSRLPPYGSVSSNSSSAPRTSSLSSSYGPSIASSVTSLASGRISPNCALSPVIDPGLAAAGLYPGSKSSEASPRPSMASLSLHRPDSPNAQQTQQNIKTLPNEPTFSLTSSNSIEPGMYICDCCPKKPRKFATEEDLRYATCCFFPVPIARPTVETNHSLTAL